MIHDPILPLNFEKLRINLLSLDNKELAQVFAKKRVPGDVMSPYFGLLPKVDIQSQFTGLSEEQTFLQALTYLNLCRDMAQSFNNKFGSDEKQTVLDFGCGWGRITQLLSLYFKAEHITAGDVMPAAINICKEVGVQARCEHLKIWPPSLIKDSSIDYIFAYSVFSHLSEENAGAWVREFSRILKPGGIAFLTTRHRSFFAYLKTLHAASDFHSFANGAAQAFKDTDATIKAYDNGIFCFDSMGSGGTELTAVYGEAFIPYAYAQRAWGPYFSKIEYCEPVTEGLLDQATLVLCK